MANGQRIAAAVLGPLAAFQVALGWYGARAVFGPYATTVLGAAYTDFRIIYSLSTLATTAGALVGAALAAGVGPGPTATVGLLVGAASAAAMWFGGSTGFYAGMGLMGFGVGFGRTALFAAVARPFGRLHGELRFAVLALVYAAVNLGALAATAEQPLLPDLHWAFAVSVGAFIAGALATGALTATRYALPTDLGPGTAEVREPAAMALPAFALLFGGGTAALVALGQQFASSRIYDGTLAPPTWFTFVNPPIVIGGCLGLAAAALGAHLAGVKVPWLVVAGAGLALNGVAALITLAVPHLGLGVAVAAEVVGALGETLQVAPLLAVVLGGLYWRDATAFAAVLSTFAALASLFAPPLDQLATAAGLGDVALAAIGVCTLLGGVLVAVGGWLLPRYLAQEPAAP